MSKMRVAGAVCKPLFVLHFNEVGFNKWDSTKWDDPLLQISIHFHAMHFHAMHVNHAMCSNFLYTTSA